MFWPFVFEYLLLFAFAALCFRHHAKVYVILVFPRYFDLVTLCRGDTNNLGCSYRVCQIAAPDR